jgi:hypothetical protein
MTDDKQESLTAFAARLTERYINRIVNEVLHTGRTRTLAGRTYLDRAQKILCDELGITSKIIFGKKGPYLSRTIQERWLTRYQK